MEEMLAAELEQEESHIAHRAAELLRELTVAPSEGGRLPGAEEMAATAWRTLLLPEIAELRPRLVPEWPLYAMVAGGGKPSALAGRIDAIAFDDGRASPRSRRRRLRVRPARRSAGGGTGRPWRSRPLFCGPAACCRTWRRIRLQFARGGNRMCRESSAFLSK
jgi:hypothetical protein